MTDRPLRLSDEVTRNGPLRFNELDPANWEHQEMARVMKVQRCGALCPNGHAWLTYGTLQTDGRIRCRACSVVANRASRKRRKAAAGGGR